MGEDHKRRLNQLIVDNQGLVYHLVGKIHRSLPVRYEYDDLVGYGMLGLAEAAKSFVPSKGVKFSTFAFFRIRGAIFDGVAEVSWMSRAEYRRHVKQSQITDETNPIGWNDTAEVVGLTPEHIESLAGDDENGSAKSLKQEANESLYQAVAQLPYREKRLITMVYFEGLSLQDAALRVGVSKSWASRLHAKVLQQLASLINQSPKTNLADSETVADVEIAVLQST